MLSESVEMKFVLLPWIEPPTFVLRGGHSLGMAFASQHKG